MSRSERALVDVLSRAAIAMPWPETDIDARLLGWARSAVVGDITIEPVPAPPPDVTFMLDERRYLVARRRLSDGPFDDLDRQVLVALVTMATTSRHAAKREARLRRQAATDDLTGLWHHSYFRELFETVAENRLAENLGVLFMDIDRFKSINEQLGHLDADEVLREIGKRLVAHLDDDALVARMGGDEFAAVIRHVDDDADLERVVEGLRAALAAPMPVRDLMLSVDVSIGSVLSTAGSDDPDDLIRESERLMRLNKRSRPGAAPPRWYDEGKALEEMLDQGLVEVAYQPVVDVATGAIEGWEALVRGRHLQLGAVSPLMLVDSAARLRLLDELSEVVVASSLATMREVTDLVDAPVTLSVNLEFEQLRRDSRLLESLADRLAGSQTRLVLEISERQLGRLDREQTVVAHRLADAGIGLAVDDFGAGYSTLALLTSWAWTWVKVDRALIANTAKSGVADDPGSRLFGHVAHMLGDLELVAVAEGVETSEQLARVRASGIALSQGTFLAPPQSAADVLAGVRERGLTLPG